MKFAIFDKKISMRALTLLFIFVLSINYSFGQSNQYLHFDGENDYVAVDSAASLIANQNTISMTGWFKADKHQYGAGMMGIRGNGTGTGGFYILQLGGGALECRLLTNTGLHEVVCPAGTIIPNQWQHIAFTYDGSSIKMFVDGVQIGSSSASGVISSLDKPFAVGKSLEGGFNFVYPGGADEVSLWTKALSSTEINNMISNELNGNETDLVLYYKFNHGYPNGNNTSLTEVHSSSSFGDYPMQINNMTLDGDSSNFLGTLNPQVQAISFPQLQDKVTIDNPFTISAESTSQLPVEFEIVSGPASVSGNTITLDGTAGTVTVKAKQNGNVNFNAAEDVSSSFEVVDAIANAPNIDIRNPLAGDFYMSTFSPIQLAALIDIDYDELFDVDAIYFYVDDVPIGIKDWGNQHYTAWWTPSSYGQHTFKVEAINNFGGSQVEEVNFEIVSSTPNLTLNAFEDMWLDLDNFTETIEAELPSYVGAFDSIHATLYIDCPPGGCDPWDRVSSLEVKGHDGEWYQIIRYLTPYGVACSHEIDLTDFMSLLQGKVSFRGNLGTQGNGFLYTLELSYFQGIPTYKYSTIDRLWSETYDFGNLANLQPCETYSFEYAENTLASTLKLVSTGHGWGDNNTDNAAEFHEDTHHIWVDGNETFTQHNWNTCNPNPDACSPQNGTWYFDRAGWCPGSIAQWFDYDMTPYISTSSPVVLDYIFDEDYVDYCHPNNSNCQSGVTCPNCNDGFNPHLIVKSHLISFSNSPYNTDTTYQPTVNVQELPSISFSVYPNPNVGRFIVSTEQITEAGKISIYTIDGKLVKSVEFTAKTSNVEIDLQDKAKGIYVVQVVLPNGTLTKKVIVE